MKKSIPVFIASTTIILLVGCATVPVREAYSPPQKERLATVAQEVKAPVPPAKQEVAFPAPPEAKVTGAPVAKAEALATPATRIAVPAGLETKAAGAPAAPPTPSLPAQGKNAKTPETFDVTPLTLYSDLDSDDKAKGSIFSNSYTRISITSTVKESAETGQQSTGIGDASGNSTLLLPYKPRGWFKRFFWGKKFDLNLSARLKVGGYETTAPLITISHQSNSSGEQWARSIKHKLLNFPLFLVKEDGEASIPEIRISLVGTQEYTSSMAGAALQVAVAGIQQVAPEATVLTTLTEQSTKDKARAIDDAIGKLFNSGINEEHVTHRDLRKWCKEGGARVELRIPENEGDWDGILRTVGHWTISFDDPRPSIFSEWRVCGTSNAGIRCKPTREEALKEIYKDVREAGAGQILNYTLVKNGSGLGTIRGYLLQQDWYVSAQSSFSGDASSNNKTAENLCRNISNAITGLGLNGTDAKLVVWAVIHGLPLPNTLRSDDVYKHAETCRRVLTLVDSAR